MNKLPPSKKPWPAEKVESRAIADLLPYARNARTHSKEQVAQIAASIEEFGWTVPVLVDETGTLIAGHGRVLAAKKLGLVNVPCMTAIGWSDAQRRAYVIADNKLAFNAGWDEDLLKQEMADLGELNFDVSLTGFSIVELDGLLGESIANDADAEWKDMPAFDQQDEMAFRTIKVHFKEQADVDAFAKLIDQDLSDKTRYVWHPRVEPVKAADKRYAADE